MSAAEQSCPANPEDAADLAALEAMVWVVPRYSRNAVDSAGRTMAELLRTPPYWTPENYAAWDDSREVINNWRSAHAYPLNTFQVNLRAKARNIDPNAVIAQRTKRLWSIGHKLDRFRTMQLSQMQDIGGCRAILSSPAQVEELVQAYRKSSLRHSKRVTDYILQPRASGYRGVHLIWKYHSDKLAKSSYNGLQIEMQIRSNLQHAWATTVETIGTITKQALKSSLGEGDWLRFFALMGSAIALREGAPPVPGTPTDMNDLIAELRQNAQRVNATGRLVGIASVLKTLEEPSAKASGAHYFLMEIQQDFLQVTGFKANEQKEAQDSYTELEGRIAGHDNWDAVLVSVDSVASLRRAYPNYFLDTRVFGEILEAALTGCLLESSLNET